MRSPPPSPIVGSGRSAHVMLQHFVMLLWYMVDRKRPLAPGVLGAVQSILNVWKPPPPVPTRSHRRGLRPASISISAWRFRDVVDLQDS